MIRNEHELESFLNVDFESKENIFHVFTVDTKSSLLIPIRRYLSDKALVGVDSYATSVPSTCQEVIDMVNKTDWTSGEKLLCVEFMNIGGERNFYAYTIPHSMAFGENNHEG